MTQSDFQMVINAFKMYANVFSQHTC